MLYAVSAGPTGLPRSQRSPLALGETSREFATVFVGNRIQQRVCHCVSWEQDPTLFLHVTGPVEILWAKFCTDCSGKKSRG